MERAAPQAHTAGSHRAGKGAGAPCVPATQGATRPVPAVALMRTVSGVWLPPARSAAASQQGTEPDAFTGRGSDGRFCFGYKEAQIVSKCSVSKPNRLPLRTLHCLGVALFNLFVSAKYLALNCNSP